jgi:hypothetical protein
MKIRIRKVQRLFMFCLVTEQLKHYKKMFTKKQYLSSKNSINYLIINIFVMAHEFNAIDQIESLFLRTGLKINGIA